MDSANSFWSGHKKHTNNFPFKCIQLLHTQNEHHSQVKWTTLIISQLYTNKLVRESWPPGALLRPQETKATNYKKKKKSMLAITESYQNNQRITCLLYMRLFPTHPTDKQVWFEGCTLPIAPKWSATNGLVPDNTAHSQRSYEVPSFTRIQYLRPSLVNAPLAPKCIYTYVNGGNHQKLTNYSKLMFFTVSVYRLTL